MARKHLVALLIAVPVAGLAAGAISSESAVVLFTLSPPTSPSSFGWAVATGNIEQDEYPDLVIGAPSAPVSGDTAGRVYAFSGAAGSQILDIANPDIGAELGVNQYSGFGYSVATSDV